MKIQTRIMGVIEGTLVQREGEMEFPMGISLKAPPPKPKALELQIDSSVSELPFYEEVHNQDFGASADHFTR